MNILEEANKIVNLRSEEKERMYGPMSFTNEQAAKEQRNFVGNGKVVWTDGNVKVADKVVTNTDHNKARDIKVNAAEEVILPF